MIHFQLRNDRYEVSFPYDAWLIDWIKTNVPRAARRYDQDTKTWSIALPFAAHMALACKAAGYPVAID